MYVSGSCVVSLPQRVEVLIVCSAGDGAISPVDGADDYGDGVVRRSGGKVEVGNFPADFQGRDPDLIADLINPRILLKMRAKFIDQTFYLDPNSSSSMNILDYSGHEMAKSPKTYKFDPDRLAQMTTTEKQNLRSAFITRIFNDSGATYWMEDSKSCSNTIKWQCLGFNNLHRFKAGYIDTAGNTLILPKRGSRGVEHLPIRQEYKDPGRG